MKSHPIIIGMSALVLAGSFAVVGISSVTQTDVIHEQNALISTLSADSTALRQQVKDTGETPVAPAPSVRVGDTGLTGEVGSTGLTGATGGIGATGLTGAAGADGLPGATGATGESITGANGTNGGMGDTGAAGATGQDGQNGADGAAGAPGADGQPPYTWSYTDPAGVTYLCTRSDPFDVNAPDYTCTTN